MKNPGNASEPQSLDCAKSEPQSEDCAKSEPQSEDCATPQVSAAKLAASKELAVGFATLTYGGFATFRLRL
jgi:hypothetical protein